MSVALRRGADFGCAPQLVVEPHPSPQTDDSASLGLLSENSLLEVQGKCPAFESGPIVP